MLANLCLGRAPPKLVGTSWRKWWGATWPSKKVALKGPQRSHRKCLLFCVRRSWLFQGPYALKRIGSRFAPIDSLHSWRCSPDGTERKSVRVNCKMRSVRHWGESCMLVGAAPKLYVRSLCGFLVGGFAGRAVKPRAFSISPVMAKASMLGTACATRARN